MNPIAFRSKVKVTIDMYGNKLVTLLLIRPCGRVFVTVWPCEHDRNWTVVCLFIKIGRHVHYDKRMNPIDFGGQRLRSRWTCMEISLWTRKRLNRCVLFRQTWQTFSLWREDKLFWFWRSKVNVTIGIYGNKLVDRIETKTLWASSSKLADMLTMAGE